MCKWNKCPGVKLLGHMIVACFIFFLKTAELFFQSSCASLKSHQRCVSHPAPQHPCQQLLLSLFFFKFYKSDRCTVLSHCGFICISLMDNDVEHLFICLFAICTSSLVKLFISFALFLIVLSLFYC